MLEGMQVSMAVMRGMRGKRLQLALYLSALKDPASSWQPCFDKSSVMRLAWPIEPQVHIPRHFSKAQDLAGSEELLRRAAECLADTRPHDSGVRPAASGDDEIDALIWFAWESGLMFEAAGVQDYMASHAMKGGKEHQVAHIIAMERVLKDLDAHAPATESVFDYLTDLLLSNYFFDDDLRIEGFYLHNERLHILTSQPFVKGIHPEWIDLKAGLVAQGLSDPQPRSHGGNFILPDPVLGDVDVFDLHNNNVIQDSSGRMNPIDAHFFFPNRATRINALRKLGLIGAAADADVEGFEK